MKSSCHFVNLEMVGRLRVFAESYRVCVPDLKSVGWQCAILGQLVVNHSHYVLIEKVISHSL